MFSISQGKGFKITFENGWTISVQFGLYNYCDNRDNRQEPRDDSDYRCKNAEVGIFSAAGWHRLDGESDDVVGWKNAAEVLELINLTASLPSVKRKEESAK